LADSDNFVASELERVFCNHVLLPVVEAVHASSSSAAASPAASTPRTVVVDRVADGSLSGAMPGMAD
jgi:hypothetical protein